MKVIFEIVVKILFRIPIFALKTSHKYFNYVTNNERFSQ
jgi:hypothetical protein